MRIGTYRWLEFMRRRYEREERERRRHHRHHHKDDFTVKLEFDMSGATLSIAVGDNTHSAVLTTANSDGSPASGITIGYTSDTPAVCAVDATSGALTPVAAGTATITGTGTRGAFTHSDTGVVTVTDVNDGDFAVSLQLQ
jgi:hypothetical protein